MERAEILSHIDHTALSPSLTREEAGAACEEALRWRTASVCIPPTFVAWARHAFPALRICTVVGFPLGYHTTAVKLCEARQAAANGADELDMVVNLGDVKAGLFDCVEREIRLVREAAGARVLKVIVETCELTREEKLALCRCVTAGGADYIKTSTGFGRAGAALDDIALFRGEIGPGVKIKAAGGIRTREAMEAFLRAGCDRIGTSGTAALFGGEER